MKALEDENTRLSTTMVSEEMLATVTRLFLSG
ncbi:hypothetical protein GGD63_007954 [Bradyrhizobium sp. cir1]|nr:hypothetical protein [Bradyrhizobium sp. cir1]